MSVASSWLAFLEEGEVIKGCSHFHAWELNCERDGWRGESREGHSCKQDLFVFTHPHCMQCQRVYWPSAYVNPRATLSPPTVSLLSGVML